MLNRIKELRTTAFACDPLELLSANVTEVTEQDFRTLNNDQQRAFMAAALAKPSFSSEKSMAGI